MAGAALPLNSFAVPVSQNQNRGIRRTHLANL
jgi:hypothetical protein